MSAYYNELNPKAARSRRKLIGAKLIAPGDVDERDIRNVKADDLKGYTQCHFFAGIGGWSYALRLANWQDDQPVWTGSCPCQPLSNAGQRKGHADERHLWPAFYTLITQRHPPVIFGEQVATKIGKEWIAGVRKDLEEGRYAVGAAVIPAKGVGANHERQRAWFVANTTVQQGIYKPYIRKATQRLHNNENYWEANPWDAAKPKVYSLDDGLLSCVDIYHQLGNAIVPQVGQIFIEAFMECAP